MYGAEVDSSGDAKAAIEQYRQAQRAIQNAIAAQGLKMEENARMLGLLRTANLAAGERLEESGTVGLAVKRARGLRGTKRTIQAQHGGGNSITISTRKRKRSESPGAQLQEELAHKEEVEANQLKTMQVLAMAQPRMMDDVPLAPPTAAVIEDFFRTENGDTASEFQSTSARANAIHSSAALFRTPSSTSKRYTRPPMSKLFASLHLTPEAFLQLQAAAKSYMLDPAYPDRQSCVGSRGKGDTDMVKLRLYNCASDFLENQGHGLKYFGADTFDELGNRRRHCWPRDANKVIALVTPLLRRMVTNERQRQYAVETRRGGTVKKQGQGSSDSDEEQATPEGGGALGAGRAIETNGLDHQALKRPNGTTQAPKSRKPLQPMQTTPYDVVSPIPRSVQDTSLPHTIRIYVLSPDSRPVGARIEVPFSPHITLAGLRSSVSQHIRNSPLGQLFQQSANLAPSTQGTEEAVSAQNSRRSSRAQQDTGRRIDTASIRIQAPTMSMGMLDLDSENDWQAAVREASECIWLDGVVKVLVFVTHG